MKYGMDIIEKDQAPILAFQTDLIQLLSALALEQDRQEDERALAHSATASGKR